MTRKGVWANNRDGRVWFVNIVEENESKHCLGINGSGFDFINGSNSKTLRFASD